MHAQSDQRSATKFEASEVLDTIEAGLTNVIKLLELKLRAIRVLAGRSPSDDTNPKINAKADGNGARYFAVLVVKDLATRFQEYPHAWDEFACGVASEEQRKALRAEVQAALKEVFNS